jgi:hypothetical protein
MAAKRKFELSKFLEVLSLRSISTGIIARRLKCHISTARRYLRELKAAKQVIERRISNTINLWRLTGKRICLIDVDSKIPNLALMKISAWYKAKGDNIELLRGSQVVLSDKPDKVYASIVFKKNKHALDYLLFQHPEIDIDIGGSGYDLQKELPPEIENMKPDYNLYSEFDYSIGFSSRGCFRACDFCVVPEKEGMFRKVNHPENWYNPEYKKIVFLDNNILTNRKWFMKVTSWCIAKKLSVWFTQGLDIRRVNEVVARRLLELKHFGMIAFSWDNIDDEKIIKEKIALLKSAGFSNNKLRAKVQFYIYVDNDSDEEYTSGVYRCRELKNLNCNSFVMFNIDNKKTQRINDLQRWTIRKLFYWLNDITNFKDNIKASKISKKLHQSNVSIP